MKPPSSLKEIPSFEALLRATLPDRRAGSLYLQIQNACIYEEGTAQIGLIGLPLSDMIENADDIHPLCVEMRTESAKEAKAIRENLPVGKICRFHLRPKEAGNRRLPVAPAFEVQGEPYRFVYRGIKGTPARTGYDIAFKNLPEVLAIKTEDEDGKRGLLLAHRKAVHQDILQRSADKGDPLLAQSVVRLENGMLAALGRVEPAPEVFAVEITGIKPMFEGYGLGSRLPEDTDLVGLVKKPERLRNREVRINLGQQRTHKIIRCRLEKELSLPYLSFIGTRYWPTRLFITEKNWELIWPTPKEQPSQKKGRRLSSRALEKK